MKYTAVISLFLISLFSSGASQFQGESIEFVCLKAHKATNTCHFNFIIDSCIYASMMNLKSRVLLSFIVNMTAVSYYGYNLKFFPKLQIP